MIGVPFEDNDLTCLGSITEIVVGLLNPPDPALVELASRFQSTDELAAWIRSLPQRNDEGIPGDDPKVAACAPPQRLRIPAADPNCVERAALYLAVAELIEPRPGRRLATLDYSWGRHTFPVEEGVPLVLDPRATYEELLAAVQREERDRTAAAPVAPEVEVHARNRRRAHIISHRRSINADESAPSFDASMMPERPAGPGPVAIDVGDAIDFTTLLGQQGAAATRNGPSRAYLARNAIQDLVNHGSAPNDPRVLESISWFLSMAEQVATNYGPRALKIVRTSAVAISDLIDDVLTGRQRDPRLARNLSIEIGGHKLGVPSWLTSAGSLVGKIGLDVGALALGPKLTALGITGPMLELVEQELNTEGLSLGPLVNPKRSFSSALSSLSRRPA